VPGSKFSIGLVRYTYVHNEDILLRKVVCKSNSLDTYPTQ